MVDPSYDEPHPELARGSTTGFARAHHESACRGTHNGFSAFCQRRAVHRLAINLPAGGIEPHDLAGAGDLAVVQPVVDHHHLVARRIADDIVEAEAWRAEFRHCAAPIGVERGLAYDRGMYRDLRRARADEARVVGEIRQHTLDVAAVPGRDPFGSGLL